MQMNISFGFSPSPYMPYKQIKKKKKKIQHFVSTKEENGRSQILTFIYRHNTTIAMCISTQLPDSSVIGFILFGISIPPFPVSALHQTKPNPNSCHVQFILPLSLSLREELCALECSLFDRLLHLFKMYMFFSFYIREKKAKRMCLTHEEK